MNDTAPIVQMIPVDQINVLNPRSRNKVAFQGIVANISSLGLKKPITVARRIEPIDGKPYDLVCGQGRLEAFMALGQVEIPAIVKEASREECFLMSLVENIARRQIRPLELLREIDSLKSRGYNTTEIAKKIDVDEELCVIRRRQQPRGDRLPGGRVRPALRAAIGDCDRRHHRSPNPSGACTLSCPGERYQMYAAFPFILTLTPSSEVEAFTPLKSLPVHCPGVTEARRGSFGSARWEPLISSHVPPAKFAYPP